MGLCFPQDYIIFLFVAAGLTTEVSIKSCFPSALCLNGSLNTGALRVTLSTLCCNTDNCNPGSPPGNLFVLMESNDESNDQEGGYGINLVTI